MAPMTIIMIIYNNSKPDNYYGMIIIMSNFPYLNMSANFYLYFLSGQMFRDKVGELFASYVRLLCSTPKPSREVRLPASVTSEAYLLNADSHSEQRTTPTFYKSTPL